MQKISEIITSDKFVDFMFNADSEEIYNKEEVLELKNFIKNVIKENQEHVAEIENVYDKMIKLSQKNGRVKVKWNLNGQEIQ